MNDYHVGKMKNVFSMVVFSMLMVCLPTISSADPIVAQVLPDPNFASVQMIIVSTTNPFSILGIDTKGTAAVAVLDNGIPVEANATFIGNVLPSPFGNSVLFALNLPTVTEADKADLLYGGLSVTGNLATVPAIFTQASPTLTDPALLALLGGALFDFSFTSSTVINGDNVSVWTMTEIRHTDTIPGVPEPNSLFLMASAIVGIMLIRGRGRLLRTFETFTGAAESRN